MDTATKTVTRRLKQVQAFINPDVELHWKQLLVLPDDAPVTVRGPPPSDGGGATTIAVGGRGVLTFRALPHTLALVLSALDTPYETENPVPKYPVLELAAINADSGAVPAPDVWGALYALWTLFHTQEYIPVHLDPALPSAYLLSSGLARRAVRPGPGAESPTLYLDRGAFWQGAGTGPQWGNTRGWARGADAARSASFPITPSFTRTDLVIAAHPLRAPKPPAGTCIYKRHCATAGRMQMLAFHVVDPDDAAHMAAFHCWHNDARVHRGWGERGTVAQHAAYVARVTADPAVLPFMMSWDGELMGYAEVVWVKENHVAPYIPDGAQDYDRGKHVLVGEDKFRGEEYAQAWFRSITHYIFLADARTQRVVGEPRRDNPAIVRTCTGAGMHVLTFFDFPYKRSVLMINLREHFFKQDMLT